MSARHAREPSRGGSSQLRSSRTPVALAIAALMSMPCAQSEAAPPAGMLPQDGSVASGSARISMPAANAMLIDQSSRSAIVEWGSFSIGSKASVTIRQPDAAAAILNRVVGGNRSEIDGQLTANGRVFLVNPNGILFGAGSRVDVGGLVASTLDIRNEAFERGVVDGRFVFSGDAASPGSGTGATSGRGPIW